MTPKSKPDDKPQASPQPEGKVKLPGQPSKNDVKPEKNTSIVQASQKGKRAEPLSEKITIGSSSKKGIMDSLEKSTEKKPLKSQKDKLERLKEKYQSNKMKAEGHRMKKINQAEKEAFHEAEAEKLKKLYEAEKKRRLAEADKLEEEAREARNLVKKLDQE